MVNRREFLQYTGTGLLLAGVTTATACGGVRRGDRSVSDQWKEMVEGLGKDDVEILRLASLAPSGHNTQPWTVRIAGPKHWTVSSERRSWLPAVDPDNREMLLSLGAFLENMVIGARTLGLEAEIKILAASPTEADIADVRFRKAAPRDSSADHDHFLDTIRKRRTLRSGFSGREIEAGDLRYLTRHDEEPCVSTVVPSPHAFFFPNGSTAGKTLQEGLIEANRIQVSRDPAQEELSRWIRWSAKDAKLNRDGLTPDSMEIGGMAGWYVRHFYDAGSVLKKDFRERTVDTVARQVRTCGGWLVVTSLDSEVSTLISYGMAFERMFLKARDKMIGLHPMTQMLEEQGSAKNEVAKALGLPGRAQWILRLGYVTSYPDPVSLRRPVSRFVRS
jgi:hypothetical protein